MNADICLNAAMKASINAGKTLKDRFYQPQVPLVNSGRDIKLAIDKEIEEEIKRELQEFGFNFLGEETGFDADQTSEYFWVVDPLDGTSNYFRRIPICANSIALMDSKLNVHVAVVNNFLDDKLYIAAKGKGSFCNNKPLKVSDISNKAQATLMTGIPAKSTYLNSEFEELIISFQNWKKVRMIGSATVAGTWVAEGLADTYQEKSIFIWDIASTMLLIKEAGGKVSISPPDQNMRVDAKFTNNVLT
jgi:myo-inositol-1(or 4)-monophosphatase